MNCLTKNKTMPLTGKIVNKYLKKYPNKNSTELANMIFEENKEHFKNAEIIRSRIRYYRGTNGKKNFKTLSTTNFKKLASKKSLFYYICYTCSNFSNISLRIGISTPCFPQRALYCLR